MHEKDIKLSKRAQSLWAKSNRENGESWLPLYLHMCDSAGVAIKLWDEWLPCGTREIIARPFGGDIQLARKLVCFLVGVHDIGKATPMFQARPLRFGQNSEEFDLSWRAREAGLPFRLGNGIRLPSHPIAGQVIIEAYCTKKLNWEGERAKSYASVIGAHHGRPPQQEEVSKARKEQLREMGWDTGTGADAKTNDAWKNVQTELVELMRAFADLSDGDAGILKGTFLPIHAASLVVGLAIMADWIASNTELFELVPTKAGRGMPCLQDGALDINALDERLNKAWGALDILPAWSGTGIPGFGDETTFAARFGLAAECDTRPVQSAAIDIASTVDEPGILVIEAPMGEGKTEAALAAAETIAARTGRGGVCIALPTMATTDAMFGRVHTWLERIPQNQGENSLSVYLAHGKARLNDEFQGIIRASHANARQASMYEDSPKTDTCSANSFFKAVTEQVRVSDWMFGRKRGMLSNFVVCTVDQVLMGALEMKHLALRQLSLANKVVVIDECHAYDVYMQQYLNRVLEWLGAWRTPVILLSATLPSDQRETMISSYRKGWESADQKREHTKVSWRELCRNQPEKSRSEALSPNPTGAGESGNTEQWGYPLISYSTTQGVMHRNVPASGRSQTVRLEVVKDDIANLVGLIEEQLSDGGCAGIVCNTVARAQQVAAVLEANFETEEVILTHSRFIDMDRMDNEAHLRKLLGPQATAENGQRPRRLMVVGTQVLEQSLDVDFDMLVTDIAPIDLLMQRLGRMHRHERGAGESSRPPKLRTPRCYLRGIEQFKSDGAKFKQDIEQVYQRASLLECLAVLGINNRQGGTTLILPDDIARMVRCAYDENNVASLIPQKWNTRYAEAKKKREKDNGERFVGRNRAGFARSKRRFPTKQRCKISIITDSSPKALRHPNPTRTAASAPFEIRRKASKSC